MTPITPPGISAVFVGAVQPLLLRDGATAPSAIVKRHVAGRVAVHAFGLAGDSHADRRVHGGRDKAVYLYPGEHRAFWLEALRRDELPANLVGENLATTGLSELTVRVGDLWRMGEEALLRITQPRQPCAKLAAYLRDARAPALMVRSGRSGFYAAVEHPGSAAAGDRMVLVERDHHAPTIAEINERLYRRRAPREPDEEWAVPQAPGKE